MLLKPSKIAVALLILVMSACGGGGGDDSEQLSTNACGTLGLNTKIINGTECSVSGSPVLALNLLSRDGSGSLCSGTLITPTQILTAAHCFVTDPVVSAFTEVDGKRIFGKTVHVHPDAQINASAGIATNDVAILDMEESINRPTVALLTSRSPAIGDTFSIFGYGKDSNGDIGSLRSGEMRIEDITLNHLIADYEGEGSNTCNGDSGGPAIFTLSDGNGTALIGVTSSGTSADCQEGDHSFFANLQAPSISSFIRSKAPSIRTR